ncbi:MAG TPA: hypothetical protein VFL13_06200 [Candidatus Baltobacteraceae bacterium]|nr:hypothetical protein [Candidatus Baltobacteraceae bacterium]
MAPLGRDHDTTTAFGLSTFLMTVDGPSSTLGLLVDMLSADKTLSRSDWTVSHTVASRDAFVKQLRAAGSAQRRIAFAVHTDSAVEAIKRTATRLKLGNHCLKTNAHKP